MPKITVNLGQMIADQLKEQEEAISVPYERIALYSNDAQREFDEKFWVDGEVPIIVAGGKRLLFANGAIRDISHQGFGSPPPEEEFHRLRKVLMFYRLTEERAVKKYDQHKRYVKSILQPLKNQSGHVMQRNMSDEEEQEHIAHLKALRAIVKDREAKHLEAYNNLDQFLNGTPEEQARRAEEEALAESRRQRFLAQVDQVEV